MKMCNTGYVRVLYASEQCKLCKGVNGRHWHGCRRHPDALQREREAAAAKNPLTVGDLDGLGLERRPDGALCPIGTAPAYPPGHLRPASVGEILEIPPGCLVVPFADYGPPSVPVPAGGGTSLCVRPHFPLRIVRLVIGEPEKWELHSVRVGKDSQLAGPGPISGRALAHGLPLPDAPVVMIAQDVSIELGNVTGQPHVPHAWLIVHKADLVPAGVQGGRPVTRREHCEQLARYLQAHADDALAFGSLKNKSEPVRYAQEMLGFSKANQDGVVGPYVRAQCRKYGVALPRRPNGSGFPMQSGRRTLAELQADGHPAYCLCNDCLEIMQGAHIDKRGSQADG